MTTKYDAEAIVVGGGPGGSALAAALARGGRRVLLLDKASFPRHKACSEYINAGGVQLLDEIGMLAEVIAAGGHRMEAMKVHSPHGQCFVSNFEKAEPGRAALRAPGLHARGTPTIVAHRRDSRCRHFEAPLVPDGGGQPRGRR